MEEQLHRAVAKACAQFQSAVFCVVCWPHLHWPAQPFSALLQRLTQYRAARAARSLSATGAALAFGWPFVPTAGALRALAIGAAQPDDALASASLREWHAFSRAIRTLSGSVRFRSGCWQKPGQRACPKACPPYNARAHSSGIMPIRATAPTLITLARPWTHVNRAHTSHPCFGEVACRLRLFLWQCPAGACGLRGFRERGVVTLPRWHEHGATLT